jgi:pimeloyl-ACP methyl ester carboxylesterase
MTPTLHIDYHHMPFTTIGPGRIDYERIDVGGADAPTFVMLHEGLGSLSMWKDFPQCLARATRSNVVIYSRHGYGRSAPLRVPRAIRYMHDEALVVLPQFLDELGVGNPILFGHSDGASIALIHAGGSGRAVGGIVALAPHVMVEDISVSSIAAAKISYETTNLRERLARYHDDVDGVFRGWNDIWLHPEFRSWNIEEYLPLVGCPILAIQGQEDEYGSMEQIERIGRAASNVELLKLKQCGHSAHRDQPAGVLEAVLRWMVLPCMGTLLPQLRRPAAGNSA